VNRLPHAFCSILLLLFAALPAKAQQPADDRLYQVLIDGKDCGTLTIRYQAQSNGTVQVTVRTNIQCRFLLMQYRYKLNAVEEWSHGRISSLDSAADDNGSQTRARLRTKDQKFVLQVNDTPAKRIADCAASTSFAIRPPIDAKNHAVLLDVDSGKMIDTIWKSQGNDTVPTGELRISCDKFLVSGGVDAQVWFDQEGRLVKQMFKDSGSQVSIVQVLPDKG
jgi:hypothetical protein